MSIWLAQVDAADGVSVKQIVTAASIALTVLVLAFSLWKGMRKSRLRPVFDVARVLIQCAIAVAVPVLTGVTTAPVLVLTPALVGAAIGLMQGQHLKIDVEGDRIFATRSVVGFAIWGLGVIAMQGAGLANRTGLLQAGQAVTWLSIGMTVGLIVGRHAHVASALRSAPSASAKAPGVS